MEWLSDRMWTVVAAVISALGGYIVHEKKKSDKRIEHLEADNHRNKLEIAVIQSQYKDLKADTAEIKDMLNFLVRK